MNTCAPARGGADTPRGQKVGVGASLGVGESSTGSVRKCIRVSTFGDVAQQLHQITHTRPQPFNRIHVSQTPNGTQHNPRKGLSESFLFRFSRQRVSFDQLRIFLRVDGNKGVLTSSSECLATRVKRPIGGLSNTTAGLLGCRALCESAYLSGCPFG